MYSLTRRITAVVLASELVLAAAITVTTLAYEHRQQYRAFDVRLRGRVDSILGAVTDAGDVSDSVLLDENAIHVPGGDFYAVREHSGAMVGAAPGWKAAEYSEVWRAPCSPRGQAFSVRLRGRRYRAYCLDSVRVVDPDDPGGGKAHRVSVVFAAPLHPLHQGLMRTARELAATNLLALLLTGGLAILFLRRGLRPLEALAAAAGCVSERSSSFQTPPAAREVHELRGLAETLEAVLGRLQGAFERQQRFVGDAAHELKTAVTIVKSSLQVLNFRERTPEQYREGVEACLADCARLEGLVGDMLLLATLEDAAGRRAAGFEMEAPGRRGAAGVRAAVERLRGAAELRGLRLEARIDDGCAVCLREEDASTLAQNLVLNAIQHSYPGGQVEVRLAEGAGKAVFTVRDWGEGVAAEHLPLLFDRFYRGDPSRSRKSGGTGLGLAISKAIVEASGGEIEVESRPGEGTTVRVTWPVPEGDEEGKIGGEAKAAVG
jgi:signal transduction histidine kinase